MYAVIQVGTFQYKVAEGDVFEAHRMEGKAGDKITLEQVLLIDDGKTVKVGRPYVSGAKIHAEVVRHSLADKVTAFKYRRRKDSATKKGHRQRLTELNVTKISI